MRLIPLLLFSILLFSCENSTVIQQKKQAVSETFVEQEPFTLPPLPKSMQFCGQSISFDNFDVKERLDREIIVNTYRHSATIQYLKRAHRFFPELKRILKKENVPEDMIYLCVAESGLAQVTSRSGAKGFWQFMKPTAKEYGLTVNKDIDERLNIKKSTLAACQYLKDANRIFNDWLLTCASYNRGMGGIRKDLDNQQVEDYFDLQLNAETSRYVFRILALKIILENPEAYGFFLREDEFYNPIKTKNIEITENIESIVKWAKDNGTTYRMVKILNPWLIGKKLKVKNESYFIKIPA